MLGVQVNPELEAAVRKCAKIEERTISEVLRISFREYILNKADQALDSAKIANDIGSMLSDAIEKRDIKKIERLIADIEPIQGEMTIDRISRAHTEYMARVKTRTQKAERYLEISDLMTGEKSKATAPETAKA